MRLKNFFKKAITCSALVITGLGLGSAATASAAPAANTIVFGDSYYSNPDQLRNQLRGVPVVGDWARSNYPQTDGCLQSSDNFAGVLRTKGRSVSDWSCAGETSTSMVNKIQRAINAGALNSGTRNVVIGVGVNDYGPFGAKMGFNILDPAQMTNLHISNIKAAVAKIRSVAPNANIVSSGMLEVSANGFVCGLNVIPTVPLGVPTPYNVLEEYNRTNQIAAAKASGIRFVDNLNLTRGHNTCSKNDSQRYVSGIADTTSPACHFAIHPTIVGTRALVNNVNAQLV